MFFVVLEAIAVTHSVFGGGTGPIFLSNMNCRGPESALVDCKQTHLGGSTVFCDHDEDAGVVCLGE